MAQHSIPAYEQDSISLPAGTHYRIRYKASPMERGLALHYHDHFEAFFAISDNIPYTVQGRQYTLETGNLLLIAPLALHQPCAQPGMCERIALRFAPSLPELLLGQDRELVAARTAAGTGCQGAGGSTHCPSPVDPGVRMVRTGRGLPAAAPCRRRSFRQSCTTGIGIYGAQLRRPHHLGRSGTAFFHQPVSVVPRLHPPGGLSASPVPAAKTAAAGAPFAAAGRLAPAGGRPMRLWGLCEFLSSFPGSLRN